MQLSHKISASVSTGAALNDTQSGGNYMFQDRTDAGLKLAAALGEYKDTGALVLAIPRGGVRVAFQVAMELNAEMAILVARKLPFPDNPEAGFGAIAEDGSIFIHPHAARGISKEVIDAAISQQEQEVHRRIETLRDGRPLPHIADKTVILVDDGIAVGSTMRAAVMLCKKQAASRIVVAVPVASAEIADQFATLVDRTFILESPRFFHAVAQVYRNWYDVDDREVIDILEQWEKLKSGPSTVNAG